MPASASGGERLDIKIALIGAKVDLAYPYDYLGAGPDTLEQIASGKHAFANVLKGAAHPMVIVGQGAHARSDGLAVLSLAARRSARGFCRQGSVVERLQHSPHRGRAGRRS